MNTRKVRLLAGVALVTTLQCLLPAGAAAQAGRVGDTQQVMSYSIGRWPDVEFDENNRVYLAVRGYAGTVLGGFVGPEGTPFPGPFVITAAANVTTARVCYAGDANVFLVTWLQEPNIVWGRLLRFSAGGFPAFLTDEFLISTIGGKSTEAAPSCAYSPDADRFLVTWSVVGSWLDIRGQFVSPAGTLLLGEIPIAISDAFEGFPSVAYNTRRKEFYVAYMHEVTLQTAAGTRIDAFSGNVLGTNGIYAGIGLNNYPEVAYNSRDDEYLIVTWYFSTGGPDVWGHRVDGSGAPIGDRIPVAANAFFEGGDGLGLAYNPASHSYLAVMQSAGVTDPVPGTGEAFGVQISAAGMPGQVFYATNSRPRSTIFQPRVAADPASGSFLVVANVDNSWMAGQMIATTPVSNCPYSLNDNGVNLLPAGGNGQVTLTTTAECAWTASSNASWLSILTATSGTGSTTVQYRVARNPSTAPRAAALAIGGRTFTVAQHAATVVAVDFNRDGASDILWQSRATGHLAAWRMSGVNLLEGVSLSPAIVHDTRWRIVATPDLNRNGHPDILWQHDLGYVAYWLMDGERQVSGELLTSSPLSDLGWKIVAAGDSDGDGSSDIIWQHTDGRVAVWYMDGVRYRFGDVIVALSDGQWRVVGATDINGDRRLDLVWRHADRGDVAVWLMASRVLLDGVLVNATPPDLDWSIAAVSDIDADGAADFVWHHRTTGEIAVWMMDGVVLRHGILMNPSRVTDTNWKIVGPK